MPKTTARQRPSSRGRGPVRRRFHIEYVLTPLNVRLPGAFVYASTADEAQATADQRAIDLEAKLNETTFLASVLQFDAVVTEGGEARGAAPAAQPADPSGAPLLEDPHAA